MNDINELKRMIMSLGGSATLDSLVQEYCKKHHMVIQPHFRHIVEKTLFKNEKSFRHNKANNRWEFKEAESTECLYVSDNQYFKTIRDVMLKTFNKSVPLSQGYFIIDENHAAWFPQPKNDNWENTLTEDGRFWYEQPKSESSDYEPDNKLRFVFIHDNSGYRFTGLFKFNGINEDRTRVYELVDDKVQIIKPRPYLIVCRVAYMKYYDGITEDDSPVNGGSYVAENNDAAEKYNFHHYEDDACYIFVETKYQKGYASDNAHAKSISIEQINPSYKGKDSIDGVRVVLTAFSPLLKKNVVVGWYDNATVFRDRIIDGEKTYMMKSAYSDAHLIPEEKRIFEIPRAQGNEFGIGQSNFWYIQKFDSANAFEEKLVSYIESLEQP